MYSTHFLSIVTLWNLVAVSHGQTAPVLAQNSELALAERLSRGPQLLLAPNKIKDATSIQSESQRTNTVRSIEQTLPDLMVDPVLRNKKQDSTKRRVLVATRVHFKNQTAEIDVAALERLATSAAEFADGLVIAVQADSPRSPAAIAKLRAMEKRVSRNGASVEILPVQPWGRFVAPLNALIRFAVDKKYTDILFLSQEVTVTPDAARKLLSELDENTLVVGARFPEHEFKPGETLPLDGLTTPWNTLAVWRLEKLAKLGFPLIAEGGISGVDAGVEEVTAIAIAQRLDPEHTAAKLVDLGTSGFTWDVGSFDSDEKRVEWHRRKMASKRSRPQAQIDALGLTTGQRAEVTHLQPSTPNKKQRTK